MKTIISVLIGSYLCLFIGCIRPSVPEPEVPVPPPPETVTPTPPEPSSPETTWDDIIQKREKEIKLTDEQRKTIAEKYYETGYKLYLESKYTEAKDNFRRVLELIPTHQNAKWYLQEIAILEGSFVPGDLQTEVRVRFNEIMAKIEQLTVEVQHHLAQGVRYYETEEYDRAEAEFKWVIETVKYAPYPVNLAPYEKQAEGYLTKTLNRKKEKELEIKRLQEEQARKLAEKEEEKRQEEFIRSIELLFQQASESFQAEHYQEAIRLCDKILERNPANQWALRLKDIAFQSDRARRRNQTTKALAEEWKKTFEEFRFNKIGQTGTINFPSKEKWEKISSRTARGTAQRKIASAVDIHAELILERRIRFPFGEGATLAEIVNYILEQLADTGINIIIGPGVDGSIEIRFGSDAVPVKYALEKMLESVQPEPLGYMIDNGIVVITTKQNVFASKLETRQYDILDLIIDIPEFVAPDISLAGAANPPPPAPPGPRISDQELIDLITQNLGKTAGGFNPNLGTTVSFQSPYLIVTHLPSVHKEVEQLLSGLRAAMDVVVTIESRFLQVQENFLEDIGVDILGLDNAPRLPGALGLAAVVGGANFSDLTSGIYYTTSPNRNPPPTRDLRARVEQRSPLDGVLNRVVRQTFSRPISPTASYTRLGPTQLQLILRAVEKEQRGKFLNSPRITVYNGQRGYLYMTEMFAYLRDYDIIMTQPGVVMADPIPAIFSLGSVLEVRPSVSADLKYITMEVRPQIITLNPPWRLPNLRTLTIVLQTFIPVAPFFFLVAPTFELPDVQYQSAQTNVVIPDGGTILIGGYHIGREIDYASGVPFLSKIPLIGALFSERIEVAQRQVLLILLKGNIVAMGHEEKERF